MIKKYLLPVATILALTSIGFAQSKTPSYTQYAAKAEKIRNIKVDLSTRSARMYHTNLRKAAKKGVNFAGHFVLTTWGCGTNCNDGAIVNGRTGKVYFPAELGGIGIGLCDLPDDLEALVFKPKSRLLVLNGVKGGRSLDKPVCGIYYLEWTGTSFRQIKFVSKKAVGNP